MVRRALLAVMLITVAVLLTACGGHAVTPAVRSDTHAQMPLSELRDASSTSLDGHLYVSSIFHQIGPPLTGVYRFPLTNGIPRLTPDLVYSGTTEYSTVALDSTNRLYAWNYGATPTTTISVYEPNSAVLARTIDVTAPAGYSLGNQAYIAVDTLGRIYASIHYRKSGCVRSCPTDNVVYVYAVNAHGSAKPIKTFDVTACLSSILSPCGPQPIGLAFDTEQELVVGFSNAALYLYASPATAPRLVHKLVYPAGTGVSGFALDSTNELYIVNTTVFNDSSVDEYHRALSGVWTLDRKTTLLGSGSGFSSITAGSGRLYVGNLGDALYVMSSKIAGPQKPLARLPFFYPLDAAVGR